MIHYVTIDGGCTFKCAVKAKSHSDAIEKTKKHIEKELLPNVTIHFAHCDIHSFTQDNESLYKARFGNLGDYHGRVVE